MNIHVPEKFMVNINIPEKFMDNYNKVLGHNDKVEHRLFLLLLCGTLFVFLPMITTSGQPEARFFGGIVLGGSFYVIYAIIVSAIFLFHFGKDVDDTYAKCYNLMTYLKEMKYYYLNIYAKSSHFSENGGKLYNTYIFVIHGQNKLGGVVKETIYIEDKDSLLDSNKLLKGDFSFLDDVKLM